MNPTHLIIAISGGAAGAAIVTAIKTLVTKREGLKSDRVVQIMFTMDIVIILIFFAIILAIGDTQ